MCLAVAHCCCWEARGKPAIMKDKRIGRAGDSPDRLSGGLSPAASLPAKAQAGVIALDMHGKALDFSNRLWEPLFAAASLTGWGIVGGSVFGDEGDQVGSHFTPPQAN